MAEVRRSQRDRVRPNGSGGTPAPASFRDDDGMGGLLHGTPRSATALILEEDPDLAENLTPEDRGAATQLLRSKVIDVASPRWEPPPLDTSTSFGFLVLDGLLGRRLRVGNIIRTELLSRGDILRPWDAHDASKVLPADVSWRAFGPTRIAVLDQRITTIIGRRAQLVVNFSGRLLRRARQDAYVGAISHFTRVEDRLLLTLWHMASNWGRVTPQGLCVPFRLTHAVLGEIVVARRPSVTVAMADLRRRGELIRRDDGFYVVTGDIDRLLEKITHPRNATDESHEAQPGTITEQHP